MISNIFPPILQSTQPVFLASSSDYTIYFKLSTVTSFTSIGHAQIRIVRQTNNRSIVDTTQYPDGTIYRARDGIEYNEATQTYHTSIFRTELAEAWQAGYVYKIQMRFGTSAMYENLSSFTSWKQTQINNGTFSEWSTVMIVKAISLPEVYIENMAQDSDTIAQRTETSLAPVFTGVFSLSANNKERLDTYRFMLYSGDDISDPSTLVEDSGWLQHTTSGEDSGDRHRFKSFLTNQSTYTVTYSIRTVNGYEVSDQVNSEKLPIYTFSTAQTFLSQLDGVTLRAETDTAFCQENGVIRLYLTSDHMLTGDYVITRSSERTGFNIYEDLKYLIFSKETLTDQLVFEDFTVESGVRYRYAIQLENALGIRSDPVYSAQTFSHKVDFDYSYLYHNGVQLKLQFNQQISSFKHTTLRTKQDTLGDRYPHLVQNGSAYYAEFPISGLISFHMDEDQTFFTLTPNGFAYKGEVVIPRDKFEIQGENRTTTGAPATTNYNNPSIDTNLTHDNIFIERIFREKAEEFLNSFDYKLYRSPTEGNIIVSLLNVSLTPEQALGRMIYSFSATAYEVLENDLEAMNEFGIIDIGQFTSLSNENITLSFGQVVWDMTKSTGQLKYDRGNRAFYRFDTKTADGATVALGSDTNVYSLIKQQEEISLGEGYKFSLKRVTSLWIEPYPTLTDLNDFNTERLELQANKADLLNAGVLKSDSRVINIENEISEYNDLRAALNGRETSVIMQINGAQVVIMPHRIYQLSMPTTQKNQSIQLIRAGRPVVINYICELNQTEDNSVGIVSSIEQTRIWGQIAGIFTDSAQVLKTYDYNYLKSPTYRIFNPRSNNLLQYDRAGNIIVDNTNINVYKSLNLYEIIKEETQKQVELKKNTKFLLENGELTDHKIFYTFVDLILFDIEADEGTILRIGQKSDGSDAINIQIGPTCRYTINPSTSLIKYIALEYKNSAGDIVRKPQYAVINYKCMTSLLTMVFLTEE